MKKFLTLAGCFAVIGALSLFPPQQAEGIGGAVNDAYNNHDSSNTPLPRADEPPTKQRRNQLCIEEWRKSHAFTKQECKGVWVSWDSYWYSPSYYYYDTSEGTHMKYSNCKVHVECRKGTPGSTLGYGEHNAVLRHENVHKIRRCKEQSGIKMNTSCEPLTDADIDAAIEEFEDRQDQQSYEDEKYGQGYTGTTFGE